MRQNIQTVPTRILQLQTKKTFNPIIQQNTLYCIKRICIICGYNSINQLIETNIDYWNTVKAKDAEATGETS